MSESADAIYPALEAALADVPLYASIRPADAPLKSAWVYAGSTSGTNEEEDTLYVHLWAPSVGELSELERAAFAAVDGASVPSHGEATWLRYRHESTTRTFEPDAVHATMLFTVRYWRWAGA